MWVRKVQRVREGKPGLASRSRVKFRRLEIYRLPAKLETAGLRRTTDTFGCGMPRTGCGWTLEKSKAPKARPDPKAFRDRKVSRVPKGCKAPQACRESPVSTVLKAR